MLWIYQNPIPSSKIKFVFEKKNLDIHHYKYHLKKCNWYDSSKGEHITFNSRWKHVECVHNSSMSTLVFPRGRAKVLWSLLQSNLSTSSSIKTKEIKYSGHLSSWSFLSSCQGRNYWRGSNVKPWLILFCLTNQVVGMLSITPIFKMFNV